MLTRRSTGSTGPLAFALHAFLLPFFIFSNVLPVPLSLSVFLSRILTYIKPSFFPFLTRKESLHAHIQEFRIFVLHASTLRVRKFEIGRGFSALND